MATLPSVTITAPMEGERSLGSSPVSLEGEATAGTFDSTDWVEMAMGENDTWSGSLGLMQGDNAINVRGVDVNGNIGLSASITVTLTGAGHAGNHCGFYVGASTRSSKFWNGLGW